MNARRWAYACLATSLAAAADAADIPVGTDAELTSALAAASPGDRILLAPGVYAGGLYRQGLTGVTLTSQSLENPAVFDAGGSGEVLHLTTATDVVIENLVLQNYSGNGLNIDDGGNWPAGKSDNITLRNLVIRNNIAPAGNRDGIKLSGVDNFHIDRVQVTNWGTGGSAIDPVGSHHGVIENSIFTHAALDGGSGIRPKGGSKDIQIRANLLDLNAGRAIQAGGSTGAEFFRFVPGDAGYEASEISAFGNILLGGESAVSWVNIDGGVFGYNYIETPSHWVMRMLNENAGSSIVDTRNGVFSRNIIVYDEDLSRISNHDGPEVLEETFSFARNRWFNGDTGGAAGGAELQLPTEEKFGNYGVDPQIDPDGPVMFSTHWGKWIVNPHLESSSISIEGLADYFLATPGENASLDPLRASPFVGGWEFIQLDIPTLDVPAQSQVLLWSGAVIESPFYDYNNNGITEQADLDLVLTNWGTDASDVPTSWVNAPPVGVVDQPELDQVLVTWGDRIVEPFAMSVPEPPTLTAALAAILMLLASRFFVPHGRGSSVASTNR